jgi:hypothetical protein
MFRATVADDQGHTLLVRSPSDAEFLALTLNADLPQAGGGGSGSSRVIRYSIAPARRGATMIVSDDRGRDKGQIRPGMVGVTSDRQLAERVARHLNEVDPATLKPQPKGIGMGWW